MFPSRRSNSDEREACLRQPLLATTIPAGTHVDHSAGILTVRRTDNPLYYDIIRTFYELTGCE